MRESECSTSIAHYTLTLGYGRHLSPLLPPIVWPDPQPLKLLVPVYEPPYPLNTAPLRGRHIVAHCARNHKLHRQCIQCDIPSTQTSKLLRTLLAVPRTPRSRSSCAPNASQVKHTTTAPARARPHPRGSGPMAHTTSTSTPSSTPDRRLTNPLRCSQYSPHMRRQQLSLSGWLHHRTRMSLSRVDPHCTPATHSETRAAPLTHVLHMRPLCPLSSVHVLSTTSRTLNVNKR